MVVTQWLDETFRTYFSNATAVRDFRVQMRGPRTFGFLSAFMLLVVVVALTVYENAVHASRYGIVQAQVQLVMLYDTMAIMLALMITLVTPALSATAIVAERARRSFDLVFSAPVSPRYYLIGKAISSYAYTWMVLVLCLPVTTVCVLLGGATWQEVFLLYWMLSALGLVYAGIALLMSCMQRTVIAALLWSYAAIGLLMLPIAGPYSIMIMYSGVGGATREGSVLLLLNPFTAHTGLDTWTNIAGNQVPNWILASALCLLAFRFLLLGAAVLLDPTNQKLIGVFRMHALAYAAGLGLSVGYALVGPLWGASGIWDSQEILAVSLLWLPVVSMVAVNVTSSGFDRERRFWPNGLFDIRRTLDGTPAGALPFLYFLTLAFVGSAIFGVHQTGNLRPQADPWLQVFTILSFVTFTWAVGLLTTKSLDNLRQSRVTHFNILVALYVLPIGLLASISAQNLEMGNEWFFHILRPVWDADMPPFIRTAYCVGFLVASAALVIYARREFKRRIEELRYV